MLSCQRGPISDPHFQSWNCVKLCSLLNLTEPNINLTELLMRNKYEILEKAELICSNSASLDAWGQGWVVEFKGGWGRFLRWSKFLNLNYFSKTHHTVHLKLAHFTVYKSYVTEINLKTKVLFERSFPFNDARYDYLESIKVFGFWNHLALTWFRGALWHIRYSQGD